MSSTTDRKNLHGITIDPNIRDYRKDPFFVKKAEKARATIAKYGLPKESKSKKSK